MKQPKIAGALTFLVPLALMGCDDRSSGGAGAPGSGGLEPVGGAVGVGGAAGNTGDLSSGGASLGGKGGGLGGAVGDTGGSGSGGATSGSGGATSGSGGATSGSGGASSGGKGGASSGGKGGASSGGKGGASSGGKGGGIGGSSAGGSSGGGGGTALLDDFESYDVGHVDDVTGGVWTSVSYEGFPTKGHAEIVEDGGNKYGLISGGDKAEHDGYGIRRKLKATISKSNKATTLYVRIMPEETAMNCSFGLSHEDKPHNYDSFKVHFQMVEDGFAVKDGKDQIRQLKKTVPRTWYNVWAVIDNSKNSYDFYVTENGDATGSKALRTGVKFRIPATASGPASPTDLVSFWAFSSSRLIATQQSGPNPCRVDNVAVTDGVNLTVPK